LCRCAREGATDSLCQCLPQPLYLLSGCLGDYSKSRPIYYRLSINLQCGYAGLLQRFTIEEYRSMEKPSGLLQNCLPVLSQSWRRRQCRRRVRIAMLSQVEGLRLLQFLAFLCPQFSSEEFSHFRLGQHVPKLYILGHLVGGKPLPTPFCEIV